MTLHQTKKGLYTILASVGAAVLLATLLAAVGSVQATNDDARLQPLDAFETNETESISNHENGSTPDLADTTTSTNGVATLTWNSVDNVKAYEVKRSTLPDTTSPITQVRIHQSQNFTGTTYYDGDVIPGETYRWTVEAHKSDGTTNDPITLTKTAVPTNYLYGHGVASDDRVKLVVTSYRMRTQRIELLRETVGEDLSDRGRYGVFTVGHGE